MDEFEEEPGFLGRRSSHVLALADGASAASADALALALPSSAPMMRAAIDAQPLVGFNVPQKHFQDSEDLTRPRPPNPVADQAGVPAGHQDFFFRVVDSDMQKSHILLGKAAKLGHDCVVAGLQKVLSQVGLGQDVASASCTLSPQGFPRPMKLHQHVASQPGQHGSLRVWSKAEAQAGDAGLPFITVSGPMDIDAWILTRVSDAARVAASAVGRSPKHLKRWVDALDGLAAAELLALLKDCGWSLCRVAKGDKISGWSPESEKFIWCRDGLPNRVVLVCLALSSKLFQYGLKTLLFNQPLQYYNALLALLRAGSTRLGDLPSKRSSKFYAQVQADPQNWQTAVDGGPALCDDLELEDEPGFSGQMSRKRYRI